MYNGVQTVAVCSILSTSSTSSSTSVLSGVLYRKVSPQVEWKISGLWTGLTRERWCCTMGLMSRLDMNTCLTNIKTDI